MKAIYQIYIDNLRKGIINQRELDSLENGLKQMENRINSIEQENEELHEENKKLKNRLQISPQGDDRIDELEQVINLLKFQQTK